ncbi:hypothetical protein FB45DRAFT_936253 [Roridomyces roridus]|uniref:Uncharacterized protein n=1 Tax=Roridomyces roridus TaxID=1738132 RepID=A0AAD7BA72_9AGAR|nr:hypothetical protein FB45DRAFT_936253 [Roridomyces roridus]
MLVPTILLGLLSHGVGVVSAASRMPGQRLLLDDASTMGLPLAATVSVSRSAAATASAQISASVGPTSSAFASASTHSSFALSSAKASSAAQTSSSPATKVPRFQKRTAIPECLKTVELSCLNLAANCIDTIGMDTSSINNLWGVKSCVAAATCYGVGDLISSVECQTGLSTTTTAQASLDYTNIYAPIVGSCAFATGGCPITQQNYIDFYYGQLSAINTANFPSSNAVVIAFWNAITAWAATGATVPYLNFNDWLHFSSSPSTTTTTTSAVPSYSQIAWNPNPAPPSGAVSETFVTGTSTVIIHVPTTTTVVVIATATITLGPGGTPINGPVPSGISQPGATTPTWNPNIIPPTSVSSVTFTAPPSYTTVVAVPTASNSPPQNITGPPGDKNSNGDDWWLLLFGGLVGGLLPVDVGIPGGFTPTAAPPVGWTGGWSDPDPTRTSTSSDKTSTSHSSTSSSSSSSCPSPTATYALSDDSENSDWADLGSDPDRRRGIPATNSLRNATSLERRAGRSIAVNSCGITVVNPSSISLGAGTYWTIGTKVPISVGTALTAIQVSGRPTGNGPDTTAQEHVFELGYIDQFFKTAVQAGISCNWIQTNVFNFVRRDGSNMGTALLNNIDTTSNMVWVDKPMNQAKSNLVNQNKATAADPPQSGNMNKITSFTASFNIIQDMEYFIRNFAALGSYMGNNAAVFRTIATNVQNLLAEITPASPDANLPVEFNAWLRGLVATYPAGCTSRATNAYNYYVTKMNGVRVQSNTPVPACFPLFSAGLAPQTFNFANLIPPTPTLPACDIPGTEGQVTIGNDANGNPVPLIGTFRTMGSGNTQSYAFGTGTSLNGVHYVANDLTGAYNGCNGVFQVVEDTPAAGFPDAQISLNCNGQSGNSVDASFTFSVNGQVLQCTFINKNDGSNTFFIICGSSAGVANTCAASAMAALAGTYPAAYLSTPSWTFLPN